MQKELVSIILPTYNRDWIISRAIESVLSQSYTNYELIIIDDGSTDNTLEVIEPYGNKVKYFYVENSGVAAARNKGISLSEGEFIAFIDSDDIWEVDKLEKQVLLFDNNPSYDLCYCGVNYYHNNALERDTLSHYGLIKNGFVFSKLLKKPSIATSSVVIRAKILKNIGTFNENFKLFEDRDLWLRIALNHRIYFLPNILVKMHRFSDANNLTNQESEMKIYYQILLKKLLTSKNLNIPDRLIIRGQLAKSLHDSAYDAKNKSEIDSAIRLYTESFLYTFNVRTLLVLLKLIIKK